MLEDFFENYFKIEKAYRKYFQDEMEKYHLTPNELLVLLFLARDNGGCNTARDIAQYEGVSKGLVARSVESLVEKQFLVVERMLPIRESAIYISRSNAVRSQSR